MLSNFLIDLSAHQFCTTSIVGVGTKDGLVANIVTIGNFEFGLRTKQQRVAEKE